MPKRNTHSISPGSYAFLLVLLTVTLTSTPLISEEQDIIGVYFDETCTSTCYQTVENNEYITIWLGLKYMSGTLPVVGVVTRLTVDGVGISWVTSLIGSQNFAMFDGVVEFAAEPHIQATDLILVGYAWIFVADPRTRIEFHITPVDWWEFPTPAYGTTDGQVFLLSPSSGSYEQPVAVINPDGTVPNKSFTWGQVKQLYD